MGTLLDERAGRKAGHWRDKQCLEQIRRGELLCDTDYRAAPWPPGRPQRK